MGRRLGRILVPYFTWSVLLCVLPKLLHGEATAADLGTRFLLGWTFPGGYFLLALAQLTILAPLLLGIVRRSGRSALILFSASLLAAETLFGAAAYGGGAWSRHLREGFSVSLTLCAAWAPFFIAGLWAGGVRRRLFPWMGRHRMALVFLAAAFYGASLWELRRVYALTDSLGLAASFLKPTSVLFAFAACAVCLGARTGGLVTRSGAAPLAPAWRALAKGSYAIYLVHGAVVLVLCGIASPWWQGLLATPAGPLLLGAFGIALPLAFFRLAERGAPAWARFAMFG
jgi:fucose 4-O-acetylase-like acetyltransferase